MLIKHLLLNLGINLTTYLIGSKKGNCNYRDLRQLKLVIGVRISTKLILMDTFHIHGGGFPLQGSIPCPIIILLTSIGVLFTHEEVSTPSKLRNEKNKLAYV